MTVLALDQSTTRCGYALIRNGKVAIVSSMSFKGKPISAVMFWIRELLDTATDELDDTCWLALEASYLGKNARTRSMLDELRGRILEAADSRGYYVEIVPAKRWQADAGIPRRAKREAVKAQSIAVAALRAGVDRTTLTDDAADAVNIGHSAYYRLVLRERVRKSA